MHGSMYKQKKTYTTLSNSVYIDTDSKGREEKKGAF
jgi:hypothetical protein